MSGANSLVIKKKDACAAGLLRYFTGKPCKHGHVSERYVSGGECIACNTMKRPGLAGWMKSYTRQWRADNPEKSCGYTAAWRERNPGHGAAYMAGRRAIEPEVLLAQERARYAANPEKYNEKSRAWAAANPETVALYARNRRAINAAADGNHTQKQIDDLFVLQRKRCTNCKCSIKSGYHADHIQPLCKGGSNWISNIQLLCPTCNLRKGGKDPLVFAQMNGRLV